jgi:anti-sigma factor ChrR (cupin superfamily)
MFNMECEKSLELLSEYQAGRLGEDERLIVTSHLAGCPPCAGVLKDIEAIVVSSIILRTEEGIPFPDEDVLWQRLMIGKTIH